MEVLFDSKMENGVTVLRKHEDELRQIFEGFYPELQKASQDYLNELLEK